MLEHLKTLFRYRELLYMITWREVRIKYKQSMMGFLWAIFMPLIIVAAGILVKYAMAHVAQKPFLLSEVATISVKAVPWAFFVSALRFATNSLIANTNLVTKISFPKEIFPVASVASQLIDFLVASVALTVILLVSGVGLSLQVLWAPLLIALLVLFTVGLGTVLSAASLFFRDVKYLTEVVLTFAIFFTPVFYEVEMFGKWGTVLLLNPVAPILEGLNDTVVLHESPDFLWVGYSAAVSVILLTAGYSFFKKAEPMFAESI